jgi:hypothetical protein
MLDLLRKQPTYDPPNPPQLKTPLKLPLQLLNKLLLTRLSHIKSIHLFEQIKLKSIYFRQYIPGHSIKRRVDILHQIPHIVLMGSDEFVDGFELFVEGPETQFIEGCVFDFV